MPQCAVAVRTAAQPEPPPALAARAAHAHAQRAASTSDCVPDRPTLSDFLHFRLGLPRPTDPPRVARREINGPFWVGTLLPTDPLLPKRRVGASDSFVAFFLAVFSRHRPTRRAKRGAIFFVCSKKSVRPTHLGPTLGRRAWLNFAPPERSPLSRVRRSGTSPPIITFITLIITSCEHMHMYVQHVPDTGCTLAKLQTAKSRCATTTENCIL